MEELQKIASKLIKDHKPSKCDAGHKICLHCNHCRATQPEIPRIDTTSINQYIDLTLLKPETTFQDIENLCRNATQYNFKTVCVNPHFLTFAKQTIARENPILCTVISFPLGANSAKVKLFEAKTAIAYGAKEVDMVMNISHLKAGMFNEIHNEIADIHKLCHQNDVTLKVIIETCILTWDEVVLASLLAKQAGADFIKTSTGFAQSGADVVTVGLIRTTIGTKMGIKASGGIKTLKHTIAMFKAGANRIGTSNGVQIIQEATGK